VRSLCALEQGSFDVGHGEARALTPYELQLQWRLDYSRKVPGIAAVRAQRDAGTAGRITWWIGAHGARPEIGSAVTLGQRAVGQVIHAAESPALAATIGLVLLELGVAFPGLPMGWVDVAGQRQALQTVAPPLLNNRSLFVHPHRHTFATRERVTAPPLRRVSFGTGDAA
jgi:glycine cleavage system aminomethyltransferase T